MPPSSKLFGATRRGSDLQGSNGGAGFERMGRL